MLVSVHIPKTGGSTINKLLRRKFGSRLLIEYQRPGFRHKVRSLKWRLRSFPKLAVHGHFPASKYSGTLITFVRDPVERRVSQYRYIRREHARWGTVMNATWADAVAMELDEFVCRPESTLRRYIDVPLERLSFIGMMDRFDDDVRRLCRMLEIDYEPVHENAAPTKSHISDELRARYRAINPEECAFYESVRAFAAKSRFTLE